MSALRHEPGARAIHESRFALLPALPATAGAAGSLNRAPARARGSSSGTVELRIDARSVAKQRRRHAFLRSYAGTNEAEFFAVAVEYFFERPQEFQTALPELYGTLGSLLRQDPAAEQPWSD